MYKYTKLPQFCSDQLKNVSSIYGSVGVEGTPAMVCRERSSPEVKMFEGWTCVKKFWGSCSF
jgi:hypothetical protein